MAKTKEQADATEKLNSVSANGAEARAKEQIEADIKAAQDKIKALKAEAKGQKVKAEKVIKGRMVAFKNKAGDQITGMGNLYYVARHGGKLHYKEASQVTLLPEGWKEGDAIPEPNVKEESLTA